MLGLGNKINDDITLQATLMPYHVITMSKI